MPPAARIISLLPSATEILFSLGAGPSLVGVTHECDHPPAARSLPPCTSSLLSPTLSAREIDTAVTRVLTDDPHSIYRLDHALVRALRPTLIVTQSLCAVCAVPESTVSTLACTLPDHCTVVSSDPHTLPQLFHSIAHIGKAVGRADAADALVASLRSRLNIVKSAVPHTTPRIVVLEWPDPPYAPGHWVPDMVVLAGGKCAVGESGQKSRRLGWDEMYEVQAEVVVCAFCGFDLKRNEREVEQMRGRDEWEQWVKGKSIYASDASAYFSRPGDRLVDGTELLAFVLHRVERFRPRRGAASLWDGDAWVDLADV